MKKGSKHTENEIKYLRKINLGNKNPMFGKHLTEETKEKIKKYKHTLKDLKIMRDSMLGNKNPNFGKKHPKKRLQLFKELKLGDKNPMYGISTSEESKKKFLLK